MKRNGFTLVELLSVLAIVVILVSTVLQNLGYQFCGFNCG